MREVIYTEKELADWFEINYKLLGYDEIIKYDDGTFPDYIMGKNGKNIRVELETRSSHFIMHKHDIKKVDEIVCIEKDKELDKPIIIIPTLKFIPKERITITIDNELLAWVDGEIKDKNYANRSATIENLIKKAQKRKILLEELKKLD